MAPHRTSRDDYTSPRPSSADQEPTVCSRPCYAHAPAAVQLSSVVQNINPSTGNQSAAGTRAQHRQRSVGASSPPCNFQRSTVTCVSCQLADDVVHRGFPGGAGTPGGEP